MSDVECKDCDLNYYPCKGEARIKDLERKLEQRDKALAFYANESNYDMDYDLELGHWSEMMEDCGEKAREALA